MIMRYVIRIASSTQLTMKVVSLESKENTTATEKQSFASWLLVVLIKLNFVPVKLDQNGKATFRLFSFRYVLSFACWTLPFICFNAVFVYVVHLAPAFQYGTNGLIVILLTNLAIESSAMLFALSLPYCLGYLVGQAGLAIPMEIASANLLKPFLIWALATTGLFLSEILGVETTVIGVCNKIVISWLF